MMSESNAPTLHHQALIEMALRFARERPGVRPVALVAEGDVEEAPILARGVKEWVLRGKDGSTVFMVDRDNAKEWLVRVAIQGLEFLVDEGTGPVRALPIIHMARQGIRVGAIPYKAPQP